MGRMGAYKSGPWRRATPAARMLESLVDRAAVERYRDAVAALRQPPAPGRTEERVERARAAMSGLRLGVPVTPSLYR